MVDALLGGQCRHSFQLGQVQRGPTGGWVHSLLLTSMDCAGSNHQQNTEHDVV